MNVIMAQTSVNISRDSFDRIIDLSDYRDRDGIRIVHDGRNDRKKMNRCILDKAEQYFNAASKLYVDLGNIYESAVNYKELYRISAGIIRDLFADKQVSLKPGEIRRHYGTSFMPDCFKNKITSLLSDYQKIYLIHAPVGASSAKILELLTGSAVFRGFQAEVYHCPMKSDKPEHLLLPEPGAAFLTSNQYHVFDPGLFKATIISVDLKSIYYEDFIKNRLHFLQYSRKKIDEFLEEGICCLRQVSPVHPVFQLDQNDSYVQDH